MLAISHALLQAAADSGLPALGHPTRLAASQAHLRLMTGALEAARQLADADMGSAAAQLAAIAVRLGLQVQDK